MKMFSLMRFFISMFLFQTFVVEDEGAGSGDIGDVNIEDDANSEKNPPQSSQSDKIANEKVNNTEDANSELEEVRKQLEELRADKEARETESAVQRAVSELESKHQGFEANKVKEYLVELNKTDPQKANMLNNQVGWENIWLNEFASRDVNNDDVSFGRNVAVVDRSEEVLERVNNGEFLSVDDELEVYGKHL